MHSSNDLVKRLRDKAKFWLVLPDMIEVVDLLREAADTIEVLERSRDKARQVFEFGCACGKVFDSLEEHAEHRRTHDKEK